MITTFADTHYFLAILNPRDQDHNRAIERGSNFEGRLVTTEYVLLEVGDALSRVTDRPRFLRLLDLLEVSDQVEIIPASDELFARGVQLYRERPDKEWSLTDCLSFVVMNLNRLEDALTGDRHFIQAGFRILL